MDRGDLVPDSRGPDGHVGNYPLVAWEPLGVLQVRLGQKKELRFFLGCHLLPAEAGMEMEA